MDIDPDRDLTPVQRLTRDLRNASKTLGPQEARYLVDAYYQMQRDRIRAAHQMRTLAEGAEPNLVVQWLADQTETLEKQLKGALGRYAEGSTEGQWLLSICGIGPVIAAGMICHIDVDRAKTASAVWRYAGLDPTVKWGKGQKRPWNGDLKRLCFLLAESFVKVKAREGSVYAPLYDIRKQRETERNEAGLYAETAAASLREKKFGEDTQARKHYEAGRLPPARLHMRAMRYAVKVFLAHYHSVATWCRNGVLPPVPYALDGKAHVHLIAPPHMEGVPGMADAWKARSSQLGLATVEVAEFAARFLSHPIERASAAEIEREPSAL